MDTSTLFSLEGRTALVTGGSRGIGKMIAAGFIAQGAKVYISSRKADVCDTTADELGPNCISLPQDVSTVAGCQALADTYFEHEKSLDILVNNAGITRDAPFHKMTPEQWHEVIDTNLTGVFNTVHPIWPGMRERKFGRVIVISSINGQKGQFGQVNYAATKAGDLGIVKSLAQEGARAGITANAICPGYIATEMVMAIPEEVRAKIVAGIPAGRLGEPDEIARCVAFLASDDAGFINGSTISANGAQFFV